MDVTRCMLLTFGYVRCKIQRWGDLDGQSARDSAGGDNSSELPILLLFCCSSESIIPYQYNITKSQHEMDSSSAPVRLYVGNLPYQAVASDIEALFTSLDFQVFVPPSPPPPHISSNTKTHTAQRSTSQQIHSPVAIHPTASSNSLPPQKQTAQ